eukprot:COSAG03_NODE_18365_length_356_cov_8.478599_1_plen_92_part_10
MTQRARERERERERERASEACRRRFGARRTRLRKLSASLPPSLSAASRGRERIRTDHSLQQQQPLARPLLQRAGGGGRRRLRPLFGIGLRVT